MRLPAARKSIHSSRQRSRSSVYDSETDRADPRLARIALGITAAEWANTRSAVEVDESFLYNKDDDNDVEKGEDGKTASAQSATAEHQAEPEEAELNHIRRCWGWCQSNGRTHRIGLFSCLILLIGGSSFVLILTLGLVSARDDQERNFERITDNLIHQFEIAVENLDQAGVWVHQSSTASARHENFTTTSSATEQLLLSSSARDDFLDLYRHLEFGMEAVAAEFLGLAVNVSHDYREQLELESRSYLDQRVPDYLYVGFSEHDSTRSSGPDNTLVPRSQQPYYYVTHLLEPLVPRQANDEDGTAPGIVFVDYDLLSMPTGANAVSSAIRTWKPAVTLPITYPGGGGGRRILYMHPGIPPDTQNFTGHPESLAVLDVLLRDLFELVSQTHHVENPISFYIFDTTDEGEDSYIGAQILGGARFKPGTIVLADSEGNHHHKETSELVFLPDLQFRDLDLGQFEYATQIHLDVAQRRWTFVMMASRDDFPLDHKFIVIGATMIFVACACLTLWLYTDYQRMIKISEVHQSAEADKAALIVKNARVTARTERELNDFIAHEVRNPLSAALSACSFVSSALRDGDEPLTEAKKQEVDEDVSVIESSLHFINDLLRNMLDLHRSNSNQLKLNPTPTSVHSDILQPVAGMLYRRGENFTVQVDCSPKNMVIMADKLRLKQIVLNLGRNAVKFVERGFVRLKAGRDTKGHVYIRIEDSGPGIPMEKRDRLFSKFQESLDTLHQGTGIGLAVCRKLIDLMGGDIDLDESYQSGIPDCPGACFVIRLNTTPIKLRISDLEAAGQNERSTGSAENASSTSNGAIPEPTSPSPSLHAASSEDSIAIELPDKLTVLFVDDDILVRKLFMRSLKRVAPLWNIQEASNGETGLKMTMERSYDLVFLDQYMASVDKQMLGTETAVAMRANGVKSILCGLSANDMQKAFLKAGADDFMMKPFPCAPEALKAELFKILQHGRKRSGSSFPLESIQEMTLPEHAASSDDGKDRATVEGTENESLSISEDEKDAAGPIADEIKDGLGTTTANHQRDEGGALGGGLFAALDAA